MLALLTRSLDRFPASCFAASFIAAVIYTSPVYGQTSKPEEEKITHEMLLERAMREPLSVPPYLTPEGETLSEDQQTRLKKAKENLTLAEKLRKEEKFLESAQVAGEASEQFRILLGEEHYHTVTAQIMKSAMEDYARSATSALNQLIEAQREMAKSEEFFQKGFFAEAESTGMRVLSSRERILGGKHSDLIDVLRVVGASRLELQAFDKANDALSQAVQLSERAYGRNHPKTAILLDRHGWMKINQARTSDAMTLLAEAVRILRRTTGDTAEMAEVLDNLGTAALLAGEVEDALKTKLRSLVIREKVLGHKARDTAVSLSNMAWLYGRVGMNDEVIPLREEALKVFREAVGPEHTYTKMELTNLCKAYQDYGMLDKAMALYREQIARDEKQGAQIDVSAVQRCVGYSTILIGQGQMTEARQYLDKALKRARELLDTTARQPAIGEMERIASIYDSNRIIHKAITLFEELRAIDEKLSMPTDGSVRRGEDLGHLYVMVGRLEDAEKLLKKVIADAEQVYGAGERLTATSLVTYCDVLTRLGRLEEAEKLGEKVLRICETKFPGDSTLKTRSIATAHALLRVGRIYAAQKRMELARFTLEDALSIFEKEGKDAIGIVDCRLDLADCHLATGQRDRAEVAVKDAIASIRKLATQVKSVFVDAALAKALRRQIDLGFVSGDAKREVQAELKKILLRLREAEAMDAENEKWLSELE